MDQTGRVGAPDAVVLSGGRAARLGGVDKPRLTVGGESLLAGVIAAAAAAGAARIVVVGPGGPERARAADARIVWTREDPPFGGPVAGLAAALPVVETGRVLVLTGDLVSPADAVALLLADGTEGTDGVRLDDPSGRAQWLTAVYDTAALAAAIAALPDGGRDASVRAAVRGLRLTARSASADVVRDVDTWEDLTQARHARAAQEGDQAMSESRTLPPEALDEWTLAACERIGLARDDISIPLVLDLARDIAHSVARPAAPLSAFLAGLAAGRAGGSSADQERIVRELVELAETWENREGGR